MGNVRSLALAAAGLALLAGSLPAQTGTGTFKLAGVNGASDCFSSSKPTASECVYTSPYDGQFENVTRLAGGYLPAGGATFGPSQDVFCVDFFHNSYIGQVTNVSLTNLGNLGAGWLGTYTRNSSLQDYLEAAWLAQQITSGPVTRADALDMNGAIWQIMSGYTFYRDGSNTGIKHWADLAALAWNGTSETGVTAADWVVVTPHDLVSGYPIGDSQEYITQVTPEPATLLLMGTGLLAMILAGAVMRRPTA